MPNNPLEMLQKLDAVDKPNEPTKSSGLPESSRTNEQLAEQAANGDNWHNAVLITVARLFKEGHTDEEIHAHTDSLTNAEYTIDETRAEVQVMIDGMREKPDAVEAHEKNRELRELSQLSPIDYDARRKAASKKLGVRTKTLDSEVGKLRSEAVSLDDDAVQGVVEDTEPHSAPVNAQKMANYLHGQVKQYAVLKHPDYAVAIVLWSLSTWFIDAWKIMPHLYIQSLTKGSGKTTVLELVEAWSCRSFTCANITTAALFRVIEAHRPTLLLDEVDRYLAANEELNGVMNAGHTRRTARVIRLVERDKDYTPTPFNVFGGKCLAGLGKQQDTTMDRSIVIKMEKRLDHEVVKKKPITFFDDQAGTRKGIARFAADNLMSAREMTVEVPHLGNDRAQDNWTPLFIVAELIGGQWPDLCLSAYKAIEAISAADAIEQEPVAIRMFRELSTKLDGRTGEWIGADDLRNLLINDTESEFFDWHMGNPITAKSLKKYLVDAGVKWNRTRNGSFYSLSGIKERIKRYVRA